MKNGKNSSESGWFKVTSFTKDNTAVTDTSKVAIKANNTYYWFAQENITEQVTTEGGDGSTVTVAKQGDLITYSDKKASKSDISGYEVIELNYSTNLVKAGIASVVSSTNDKAKLT